MDCQLRRFKYPNSGTSSASSTLYPAFDHDNSLSIAGSTTASMAAAGGAGAPADDGFAEDARELFADIAGVGKDTITVAQFQKALTELLSPPQEAEKRAVFQQTLNTIVSIIDTDDSGTITQQEFVKSAKVCAAATGKQVKHALHASR